MVDATPKESIKQTTTVKKRQDIKPPPLEDLVPASLLEETFYGKLESVDEPKFAVSKAFSVQCPVCKETFDQNLKLQFDIFTHLCGESNTNSLQCWYCLECCDGEERLKKHIDILHPLTTKNLLTPTFNCIICENRFNSIDMLCGHLQKVHIPNDMPYRCGVCDYRSSSRKDLIDHFHAQHSNLDVLQCNFCLLIFQVNSDQGPIEENIAMFMEHLQQHLNKTSCKKCNKCALSFTTKGSLKTHLTYDHQIPLGTKGIKPVVPNTIYIPLPKLKLNFYRDPTAYKVLQYFSSLTQCLTPGKMCIECDTAFEEEFHVIGLLKCRKCRYQTCCVRAMFEHTSSCNVGINPETNVHIDLGREVYCVCGFSSSDGNSVARHLAACDHKSAYPSAESAQENTVKRNMLDMLGLVRRSADYDEAIGESHDAVEDPDQSNAGEQTNTDGSVEKSEISENVAAVVDASDGQVESELDLTSSVQEELAAEQGAN